LFTEIEDKRTRVGESFGKTSITALVGVHRRGQQQQQQKTLNKGVGKVQHAKRCSLTPRKISEVF
jgi:hypothetical protein